MNLDRRSFLRCGAVVGGSSIFLPSWLSSLSAVEDAPKPAKLRIGCIGVGRQGTGNMKRLIKNVVAVCDVDSKHLQTAAAVVEKDSGKAPATYEDYRKLLDNKDIDAVVVTTPDHWHALITVDACDAGKDVYVEKPMSLFIDEGRAIVKAAARNKRIVQCGSQQRSDAKFRLACELVRNGRIGKIKEVKVGIPGPNFAGPAIPDAEPPAHLNYEFWLGPAPKRPYNEKRVHYLFRFFWDYSGGQLTNFGAHHLDIAQWGLGMDASGPSEVTATANFHKDQWYETPENCVITYTYANGVVMTCSMKEKQGTTFIGEKGTIYVTRGKIESDPVEILKQELTEKDERLYASKDHHQNWLDCIASRKAPICEPEVGHRSATVCHLGNIAIRLKRKIKWDPKAENFGEDKEANAATMYAYREPWKLRVE